MLLVIHGIREKPSSQSAVSLQENWSRDSQSWETGELKTTEGPVATMWQQLEYDFLWENVTQFISANGPSRYGQFFCVIWNFYKLEPSNLASEFALVGGRGVEFLFWNKLYRGKKGLHADTASRWSEGKWGHNEAFLRSLLWKLAFMWISAALLPWLGWPHLPEWSHPSRQGRQTFVPENQSGPSRALLAPLSPASEGVCSYKPDRPRRAPCPSAWSTKSKGNPKTHKVQTSCRASATCHHFWLGGLFWIEVFLEDKTTLCQWTSGLSPCY